MRSVTVALPEAPSEQPPIVLVHGAANSAGVWVFWQRALAERGWASYAVDLRGHGRSDRIDLSSTTMADYAHDVQAVIEGLARKPVVMGWSMGGLVALMVAAASDATACVALAPSVPSRTRDVSALMRRGEFGADFYGITSDDPADQPAMPDLDREERTIALTSCGPESQLARDDRKAGIMIESIPCPLLIVTGMGDVTYPRSKYDGLWLPAEHIDVEGASHWGLVLSRRALEVAVPDVVGWLETNAP
jgi:pimeloyl-ACP methyl ester carboxylesterase